MRDNKGKLSNLYLVTISATRYLHSAPATTNTNTNCRTTAVDYCSSMHVMSARDRMFTVHKNRSRNVYVDICSRGRCSGSSDHGKGRRHLNRSMYRATHTHSHTDEKVADVASERAVLERTHDRTELETSLRLSQRGEQSSVCTRENIVRVERALTVRTLRTLYGTVPVD